VLIIEVANKRTRVTLPHDFIASNLHVHFRQLAFGTTNVFLDKLVQHLPQIFLSKFSINDVVGIVFAASLLEGSLRGFLKAEPFQDVLLVGAEVLCDFSEVDDVGFNAVAFALDLGLEFGHLVAILGVINSGWNIQHLFKLI